MNASINKEPFTREPDYEYFCTPEEKAACILDGTEEFFWRDGWCFRKELSCEEAPLTEEDFYRRKRKTPWISTSERLPTEADTNGWGSVLILCENGSLGISKTKFFPGVSYWMPLPPAPVNAQNKYKCYQ